MRTLNKIALLALGASLSVVACTVEDNGDGDGTGGAGNGSGGTGEGSGGSGEGSGGSATGGMGGSATGGMGGNGMGGDGMGGNTSRACTSVTVATGEPISSETRMIDDFQDDASPWLPETDSRDGFWVEASFLTPESDMGTEETDPVLEQDGDNFFLRLACEETGDTACNTAWSSDVPFQWAATSALLINDNDVPCYDASVFDGVSFRARGDVAGQKIRLQFNTPSDDRENNVSFNSAEITLTDSWAPYTVSFDDVKLGETATVLNAEEIESISFVVRNVKVENGNGVQGESLDAYSIDLDDIAFTAAPK